MSLTRRALAPGLGLLALSARAPARAAEIPDLEGAVAARVERQMARAHIPGVAVAILKDGKPVLVRGYGRANLDWDIAVTPQTAFQLASATKIFTGVALMRLAEKGQLSLDAPLADLLAGAPEAWRDITVRQLATHTSGLGEDLGSPRPTTVAGVAAAAMARPLAYPPGSQSRYGFTDFIVLRAVLEQVSGKSIDTLFADEIVTPLGLTRTRFAHGRDTPPIRSSDVVPQRATIYAWSDGAQRASDFLYDELGYGAGGLYSSAEDLARLFTALADGRYLSAASVAALQSAPQLTSGAPGEFGVGWTVRRYHGLKVAGHSGGPALADLLHAPSAGLTVIVLTNQQRYYPLLAESLADLLLPPWTPPAAIRNPRPELAARMLETLNAAAAGRLDRAAFTERGQKDSGGFLEGFGRALLESVGSARKAELLKQETTPEGLQQTYRVTFEERVMTWRFTTAADGAIAALHPVGEPA